MSKLLVPRRQAERNSNNIRYHRIPRIWGTHANARTRVCPLRVGPEKQRTRRRRWRWGRLPLSTPSRGNSRVWPPQALKHACGTRGTHLPPRIDSILVVGTPFLFLFLVLLLSTLFPFFHILLFSSSLLFAFLSSPRTNLVAYFHHHPLLPLAPRHVPWSEFFLFSVHPSSYRIRLRWHPPNPTFFLQHIPITDLLASFIPYPRLLPTCNPLPFRIYREFSSGKRLFFFSLPHPRSDVAKRVSRGRKDPLDDQERILLGRWIRGPEFRTRSV